MASRGMDIREQRQPNEVRLVKFFCRCLSNGALG